MKVSTSLCVLGVVASWAVAAPLVVYEHGDSQVRLHDRAKAMSSIWAAMENSGIVRKELGLAADPGSYDMDPVTSRVLRFRCSILQTQYADSVYIGAAVVFILLLVLVEIFFWTPVFDCLDRIWNAEGAIRLEDTDQPTASPNTTCPSTSRPGSDHETYVMSEKVAVSAV